LWAEKEPLKPVYESVESKPEKKVTITKEDYISDDRKTITKQSRSILIIEDDPVFAKILRDAAKEKGFETLVAETGETGLHLTDLYTPDGIILDMGLPGINGKAVLFRLKDNLATRHIPVHIVSASDRSLEPLHMGAVGYLTKPVTMESMDRAFSRIEKVLSDKMKNILVVEDNEVTRDMLKDMIESGTVKTFFASTGKEAKELINTNHFDCMILDLGLPDMTGFELLIQLRKQDGFDLPVIIHTARDLTSEERAMLDSLAESIVIKDVKSMEKILDDTCLFLHRVEADLPEEKREMLKLIHDRESILENKKVLIVDDDMRNVFALMNILEDEGITTVVANNGKESLERLEENTDTELVLMDIMMPEMDGYTAMKKIRKMSSKVNKVPIIALTAKAMKGDRAICIEAGASDYLSKPVDVEKLLSMLRVWLY
jgi:CheY-like chemotaxis protein